MTDRHLSRIALLMLFTGVLLGWVLRHSEATLIDGLRSIEEARQIDKGAIAQGIGQAVDHPLHPLGIAATHRVFFGGDSPTSWQRAAVLLSFFATILWVIPLYLLGLELLGSRGAWLICLLGVANPTIGLVFVNVLSEPIFLNCWTLGLWASVRFLRQGRFSWLSAATGFGILAYWTRPEGLLLPLSLAATLLVLPLHKATRINWPRWSWALALLVVGSAALAGPYMALKGSPGTRPAVARILGLAPAADPLGLERERPVATSRASWETYRMATSRVVAVTLGVLPLSLLPFAVIGLISCRPWTASPRILILFSTIAAVSILGLIRLHATGGYCTTRHALIPGLFLTLLAAKGWDWLIEHAAIPEGWLAGSSANYRPGPVVWLALLGIAVVLPSVRDLGPSRPGPFWLYRSAADHLTALASPNDRVLDLTDWSLFFSEKGGYRFAEVFEAPSDRATRWIVLTTPLVDADRAFSPVVRELIGDRVPVVSIPEVPAPHQMQLRIYDRASTPRIADSR